MLSQTELSCWKTKRSSTYLVFMFFYFVIGLELGCINATLWIYVSTLLKTGNDKLYYGLINAAFYVPSLFFPPIVSRFVDKTRRTKLCLISILCLSLAGSILFPIYVSPLFPLVGRFLSGFTIAVSPLMLSEVARSYTSKELMQRIPLLNGSQVFGYGFGPLISIFFTKVNFWIGWIHITYANVIGPVLFLVNLALLFAVIFFSYDLSREYDMKSHTNGKNKERKDYLVGSESTVDILKRIVQNTDTLLIVTISVFFGIVDQLMCRVLPVLIIDELHFSYTFLNASFIGFSVFNTILIIVLVYWKISDKQVYYIGIISVISITVTTTLLLSIYHKIGNVTTWYVWVLLTVINLVIFHLSDQAFGVVLCAKLAFSCNQGFLEGIRTFAVQSGRIIGGVLIDMYYDYMNEFYCIINIVSILYLISMVCKRNTLCSPTPVI